MAKFIIPTPLRKFTEDQRSFETEKATVGEGINHLITTYPSLGKHLLDDQGSLRAFVNVFVGDEDIRTLQESQTPVQPESVISIVPAIAGGVS